MKNYMWWFIKVTTFCLAAIDGLLMDGSSKPRVIHLNIAHKLSAEGVLSNYITSEDKTSHAKYLFNL